MMNFNSEQDAARAVLGETVKIMQQEKIDYVILGGWIPLLFHSAHLPHPGSFDVDLLLNPKTTKKMFDANVVDKFKNLGYMLPAKNKFQLSRPLIVNGEPILFHVDLLHTNYAPYQDEDDFLVNWGQIQSISGPGTDLIFSESERFTAHLDFLLPNGIQESLSVNFANEVGFISAKGRALTSPKRKRDSYDIYMVITQSRDPKYLIEHSYSLYHSSGVFKKSVDTIKKYFFEGDKQGVKNVRKYMLLFKESIKIPEEVMVEAIESRMNHFFEQVTTK